MTPGGRGWHRLQHFLDCKMVFCNNPPMLCCALAAVAQLVEPWIVIPVVAGSSPVGRPINHGLKSRLEKSMEFRLEKEE